MNLAIRSPSKDFSINATKFYLIDISNGHDFQDGSSISLLQQKERRALLSITATKSVAIN